MSMEAAANGDVHFDQYVEVSTDGETWDVVRDGHFTVTLGYGETLAITDDEELTDNQKIAALAALLKDRIKERGLDESDEAATKINALVSFPVNVSL